MEDPSLVDERNPIIRIVFLDKDNHSTPNKIDIKIDRYRGVINGNRNFFTQFGMEMMDISKLGMKNYKKDNEK